MNTDHFQSYPYHFTTRYKIEVDYIGSLHRWFPARPSTSFLTSLRVSRPLFVDVFFFGFHLVIHIFQKLCIEIVHWNCLSEGFIRTILEKQYRGKLGVETVCWNCLLELFVGIVCWNCLLGVFIPLSDYVCPSNFLSIFIKIVLWKLFIQPNLSLSLSPPVLIYRITKEQKNKRTNEHFQTQVRMKR